MAKKKKRKKRDSYEEGTGYYGPQPTQPTTLQESITATAPGPPDSYEEGTGYYGPQQLQQTPPQAAAPPPQAAAPPPQAAAPPPQAVPPQAVPPQAAPQQGPPQEVPPEITNPGWQGGNFPAQQQQGAPVEPDTNPLPTPQQQAPDYNVPERSTPERHAERYSPERYGEYRPADEQIGRNARSDEQYKSGRMDRGLELVDQEQQTLDAVFEGGSDKQRMKWKRMYDRDASGHFDDQERQHMYHDMNQWAKEKYGKQDLAGLVDEGTLLRRRKEAEPPTLSEVAEEPEVIHDPVGYREEQGRPSRRELLEDVKGAVDEQLGRRPLPLPGGGTVDPETMELNPRASRRELLGDVKGAVDEQLSPQGRLQDVRRAVDEQLDESARGRQLPLPGGGTVNPRTGRLNPATIGDAPRVSRQSDEPTFKIPDLRGLGRAERVAYYRRLISEGKITEDQIPQEYRLRGR